ncbi:hypothetical protein ACGTN6_20445 [Halomonas sp. THAF12]|uniref:hypothetical protein n=1 Tax=Halomonas sp. B23F22_10 TaxID=3459515 RepID=UPI00373F3EFC
MQLEKTILDIAAQRLKEFKSFAESENPDDKANSMRDLFSLVELAKVQNSGLTEPAIDKLLHIEAEALAVSGQSDLAEADPETVLKNATTEVFLSPTPDQAQL